MFIVGGWLCLGLPDVAFAGDGRAVAATGVGAVVGEVAGGAALGLVGFAAGPAVCPPSDMPCWPPYLGAGVGGLGGGIAGAGLGAKLGGGRPGRAALGGAVGAVVGLPVAYGLWGLGGPSAGAVGLTLAVPAGAMIAVATDRRTDDAGPTVSIAPVVGRAFRGAVLTGRF